MCRPTATAHFTQLTNKVLTLLALITLDNKFENFFCICDDYVINLCVCIYEVRNGTLKKLLGSSFKIMLHYDILQNSLKYYMARWFK